MVNINCFRNIKVLRCGTLIWLKSQQIKRLSASATSQFEGCLIFQDDGVALVHGHEPVARVDGQHREPHTEIRRQDPVAAKALDFVVIRAGVEEMEHLVNSIANNRILT